MNDEWREILETFQAQSVEALAEMESALLGLEERPGDAELLNLVFRICHTLKGDAGAVGLLTLSRVAHRLEDVLDAIREGGLAATPKLITRLLGAIDALRDLLARGANGEDADTAASRLLMHDLDEVLGANGPREGAQQAAHDSHAAEDAGGRSGSQTLRVRVETLDRLMNLTGEIAIARSRLARLIGDLPAALQGEIRDAHEAMERLSGELQEEVMGARLVPVGPLFRQQARIVRDTALAEGKQAQLRIEEANAELDTSMVEHLREALAHLVRNAVVHGIESVEERTGTGKAPFGVVTLSARQEGHKILVTVQDDGRGLDAERIRNAALAANLVSADAALAPEDLARLIFEPGLSTARETTVSAGRGVGMDVVRRSVEAVGGTIHVASAPGRGTTFTVQLPLTLAIIDGFAVRVGEETFVLPLGSVVECVAHAGLASGGDTGLMSLRGAPVPFARLRHLMELPGKAPRRESVVVVEDGSERTGIVVDELLGGCQAVIKPLSAAFRELPGLTGSTILGDGRVALIVDPNALVASRMNELREVA